MKRAPLAVACTLALAACACKLWTVRPIENGDAGQSQAARKFDAARYVDSIWAGKLVPGILTSAVELPELAGRLKADPDAARRTFGRREGDGPWHFLAKGRGRIVELHAESRSRLLTVDLAPYDGLADVYIQIGPVIRGTALRDAAGFIHFNDFVNQLEYAAVANELNSRALKTAIPELNEPVRGRSISFCGVFTPAARGPGELIPVKLEIGSDE
jgi:predicted lipoprotein